MMDMNEFTKRLTDGHYATISGARKGIGRANGWSDKKRAEATAIAEKHFASGGKTKAPAEKAEKPAKTKAAKGTKGKKAAKVTAAAVPAERAEKSATKEKKQTATANFSHVEETIRLMKAELDLFAISKTLGVDAATIAKNAEEATQVLARCTKEVSAVLSRLSVMTDTDKANEQRFAMSVAATQPGVPVAPANGTGPSLTTPFTGFPGSPPSTAPTQG